MNSFKKLIFTVLSVFLISGIANATSVTFTTGAYVINMGVVPQTQANALKPYGLVYDLLKNNKVPVYWVISQTKAKDGIDFTYGGTDYKGGTFIVPAEFITAAIITKFSTTYAVTYTVTTSALTVDYTYKLTSAPKWTLDLQNGSIAASWFPLAGVPAASYNWKLPSTLGSCDDIFVMPHADPTWSTHGNLYNWNRTYFGSIWAGCHAVSVLENMNNGTNQTNFLANNVSTIGNALNLWTTHSGGSVPYTYINPIEVGAQFMGLTQDAHQNGSEQVYLPKTGGGWRSTTKIIAYDPTQANVPTLSGGPAGIILMGRGFGLNSAGWVMYEAGHDISKLGTGSGSQSIAAMRAFWDFSLVSSIDKVPFVSAATVPSTIQINTDNAVSVTASSPIGAVLTYQWTATLAGVATGTFASSTSSSTTFRTATAGNYIITYTITDACGRVTFVSTPVTVSTVLTPTVANETLTIDPGCSGVSTGSINVLANDSDPSGGAVTLSIVTADTSSSPKKGIITSWTSAGVVNFTASLGRSGPGSQTITYTVTGASGSATGTLTVTLGTGSAPAPVADAYTINEDAIGRFAVLSNDASANLKIKAITSAPSNGKVSISSSSTLTGNSAGIGSDNIIVYIPNADYTATTDAFTYLVENAAGNTATATVTVTMTNDACDGGTYKTASGSTTSVNLTPTQDGFLSSDKPTLNYGKSDTMLCDGDDPNKMHRLVLKFDLSSPTNIPTGATINSATLSLVMTSGNTGIYSILAAPMTRSWAEGINRNTAGTPNWNFYTGTSAWTMQSGSSPNLGGGDYDSTTYKANCIVGATGTYNWTIPAALATSWNTSTSTNYGLLLRFRTENTANKDKFFGTRENATSGNRPVLAVNYTTAPTCAAIPARAPLCNPDYFTVVNGTSNNTFSAATNDNMPAAGTNTYTKLTDPASGTASINSSSGLITYTPSGTFNGIRTFSYTVNNTLGGLDTAIVYITITNGPIVAVNDAPASANSGVTQTVTVIGNDSDPELTISAGSTHVLTIATQPVHGTATVNGSKQIVYVPTTGYSGTDVLTYSLCEPTPACGTAACSTATVTFTITNQPPPSPGSTSVDVSLCTPKTIDLFALAADPEGATLTLTALSSLSDPTKGTLVNNNNGTVTFTPNSNQAVGTAVTSFTFSLSDGTNTVNGTISINFTTPGSNAAPTANNDGPEVLVNNQVAYVDVLGNDTDPEGRALTVISITVAPTKGSAAIQANGLILYTPTNTSQTGSDNFTYQIQDLALNSSTCALTAGNTATAVVTMSLLNAPITLSGNVYNDLNGRRDSTINGTGIGILSETQLYAYYYLNGGTTILGVTPVNADGTFLFNNVTGSATYDFRISTTLVDVGGTVPAVALPADWVNRGEYNGSGAGIDASVDGILPSIAVTTASISTLKFGVEQRPTPTTITAVTQTHPGNNSNQITVPSTTFGGTDPSTGGAIASIRITAFPAGVTTIVINGQSYTSAQFAAVGSVVTPTNSLGEPTTPITFDPTSTSGPATITISYKTRDTARAESTNTGSAIQPLSSAAVVNLSGRVYNDLDGNSNNINNLTGLGNPSGATLYANLVNHYTNKVYGSVAVAANGTYSFASVLNRTYDIQISTIQGTDSSTLPSTALPDGWVNTGEYRGTGTTDGNVNGRNTGTTSAGIVVSGSSFIDINFGIEKVAIPNTETAISVLNPGGTTQSTVAATIFGATDEGAGTITSITITSYPTNVTSFSVNSVRYYVDAAARTAAGCTSPTCEIFSGSLNIPTNTSGEPTQAVSVDPISGSTTVVMTYTATDNAGKVSTLSGTANIPFHTYGISGTVYDDADGLTDNTVDGVALGNPSSTTLYANLLNTAGTSVVATVTVNANGTYSFPIVDPGTYRVQISTVQGTVSAATPATTLPTDWVPTGENQGISPGSDGTVDGIMSSITIADGSVGDVNFGIDKTPTAFDKTWTNLDPANFTTASGNGTYTLKVGLSASSGTGDGVITSSLSTNMPGKISGSDNEDGLFAGSNGGTTGTAVFTVLPNSTNSMLVYNGVLLIAGGGGSNYWNSVTSRYEITDFNNSLLEMYFKGGTSGFGFTYGFKDAAGMLGTLGTYSASGSAPLPVKLLNFDAIKLNTEVLTKWTTASEINNSHFDVQRSADTKNWLTIGTVTGNGTTNTNMYYSFIDTKPMNGINYYRLKQVDFNGISEYSNIRWVSFDKAGNNTVNLYPNPTTGIVTFSMTNQNYFENVNISISDMTGRVVLANTYANASDNKFEETLNLKDFEKGLYQITISNSGYTKTFKVLKF